MKKNILLFLAVIALSFNIKAQNGLEYVLLARDDAQKIMQAYAAPGIEGVINSMNGGWYHTAKVHGKLGFDLSFALNVSIVPTEKEMFDLTKIGLSSSTFPTVKGKNLTSTLAGSKKTTARVTHRATINGNDVSASFDMPGGIKDYVPLSAIPAPSIQFAIGLPFKLDAMFRFVPKMGVDKMRGGLFGVGVKKEITSILGPLDKLPLHISLLGAYTSMNVDYAGGVNAANIKATNASTEFKLNAYTIQAIASLNFPIINLYGGLGYNSGSANLNMLGKYALTYTGGGNTESISLNDPIKMKFSSSGFRSTLGARLSLGFFKVFADYTFQKYNTASMGVAFSFR